MSIEEAIKSTKFASEQVKAMLNVVYTGNWFMAKQTEILKPYGISPQQYNVLRILRGSAPDHLSVNEIKERMLDKTPNMTRLVDKLIKPGFVRRENCPSDGRVFYISITENGLAHMKQLDMVMVSNNKKFEVWSDKEARAISDALDKLRE